MPMVTASLEARRSWPAGSSCPAQTGNRAGPGRGACRQRDIENYDIVCCQIPGTFNILRPMTKRASGQLEFMFIRGPSRAPKPCLGMNGLRIHIADSARIS